jgi:hypothetical protein
MAAEDGLMCPRCGYATAIVTHMKRHLKRSTPCEPLCCDIDCQEAYENLFSAPTSKPTSNFQCKECSRAFASRQALYYHRKKACKRTNNSLENNDELSNKIDQLRSEMICMIQSISEAAAKAPATTITNASTSVVTTTHTTNTTNTTTHNTHNTTNNVVINAFGRERLDHITTGFMDQCVKRRDKGLVELIEKIHYDCPENQNVRATNMEYPFIQCHNGQKWVYDKKERVLNHLVDKGHGMMQEHFDDHDHRIRKSMSQTMYDHIVEWLTKMHGRDKKTLESVLTDIYLLILNSSSSSEEC